VASATVAPWAQPSASALDINPGVACAAAVGYLEQTNGDMYRLSDPNLTSPWDASVDIGLRHFGTGWTSFVAFAAGGDGVIYAIDRSGNLLWLRDRFPATGSISWTVRTVLTGLSSSTIRGMTVGRGGMIYLERTDGSLVLYRHTGHLTGEATWATPNGVVIGRGFTGLLAADGDGVLYRQVGGSLYRYRHIVAATGGVSWTNGGVGIRIGSGWTFRGLSALGSGVIYATSSNGTVTAYQDHDPNGTTANWGNPDPRIPAPPAGTLTTTWNPGTCTPTP